MSAKILHVADCLYAGVLTTIESYAQNTPEFEHHVAGTARGNREVAQRVAPAKLGIRWFEGHVQGHKRQLNAVVEQLQPDIVHGHSTIGALYARTLPKRLETSIVVTPHLYWFRRDDKPRPFRRALVALEHLLAHRTNVLAAASEHEAEVARQFGYGAVVAVPHAVERVNVDRRHPDLVVTSGRICDQKDPSWFRRVVTAAKADLPDLRWQWIGDGDPKERRRLEDAGVEVTGWLPREASRRAVAEASVYLHTAGWEVGAPLTVLEAMVSGVPVVVRDIPEMAILDASVRAATPEQAIELVRRWLFGDMEPSTAELMAFVQERHSASAQHDALLKAYGAALAQAEGAARRTLN